MYADDTQFYYSFPIKIFNKAINHINEDLTNIANISAVFYFLLNPNKLVVLWLLDERM